MPCQKSLMMEVIAVGKSKKNYREFPPHRHECWELLYNTSGTGLMLINGITHHFAEGELAVIPPFTMHGKRADTTFTDLSMFVKDFRPIGREGVNFFPDENHRLLNIMRYAQDLYEEDPLDAARRPVLNAAGDLMYQLLAWLYRKTWHDDPRINRVIEAVDANLSDPEFTLSEEIEKTGYAAGYFRRLFRKQVGMSPVKYLTRRRINYARTLICQYYTSRPLHEIALACGYEDPLYFSRVFKEETGMSPRRYIEDLRKMDIAPIFDTADPESGSDSEHH